MCHANTTTYCCICGCPFSSLDIDPDIRGSPYSYDSELLSSEDTQWLRDCTAVDQTTFTTAADDDDDDSFGQSGVSGIDALLHRIESIETARQITLNKFLPRGSELDGPVYAMHGACARIAERVRRHRLFRTAHPPPSRGAVLRDLYASLRRLHYRIGAPAHSVRWEHGYYGAARFWRNFWGQERGWEWLCADPSNIPGLTDWVLSQLRPLSADTSPPPPPPLTLRCPSADTAPYPRPALEGMPIDILRRIASFLPASATLRLRRCSKALLGRVELPQSFWRDALVRGELVGFLWDLDGAACRRKDQEKKKERKKKKKENDDDEEEEEEEEEQRQQYDWRGLARSLRAHTFVQAALRRSLAKPPVEGYGIGYLDFYASVAAQGRRRRRRGDGEDEGDGDDGTVPLGLLNRCRIVQIVEDVEHIEEEELHDCHMPLSDEEEIYAAMWIMQVSQPEKFDEYRIRRSLELYGDLSEVLESRPRVICRL